MNVNNSYGVAACGSRIGRASKTNADRAGDRSVINDNHCVGCTGEEFTIVNTGNGESIGVIIYLHVEDMSIALIVVKNNRNNYFITNICIHGCCIEYGNITGNNSGSGIIGGGGSDRSGGYATAGNLNIGCIILTKEIYMEVVGIAAYKLVIVCTTADIALLGCDPDTVTGGGVSNTPVIGACGDLNSNCFAKNYVSGSEAAVCIFGNLILKFIVNACGSIAAGGQRTGCTEYIAVSSCISVKEELITGTIAPYIFNFEDNGCSGSVGITILCLNGSIAVDSTSVVVPTGELIAFMSGRGGEIALIENGACLYGNGADSSIIKTIDEGYGEVGHFGSGNFDVIENHEACDFCAIAINGTDVTKESNLCGFGVNGVKTIVTILIVLCPEELMRGLIISDGLDILHGKSGCANESKPCGLEVNPVEVTFIGNSECIAILIDSKGHNNVSTAKCADLG